MKLEKKLHEELMRYNSINNYGKRFIAEQEEVPTDDLSDIPMDDAGADEPVGDAPAIDDPAMEDPAMEAPADEPMNDTPEDGDVEEMDITDLVNMTQNIKNDLDSQKGNTEEMTGKMGELFGKLDDLESKLSQMDNVILKIDQLGAKIEQVKEPTPQERLEMRSLDSYPFSQKPSEFFSQKKLEMEKSGKNEYVITKSDVEDYSDTNMRDSFNQTDLEDEFKY
jgi:hypothetical protein